MKKHPALKYFRFDRPGNPHLWCPGCGIPQIWYYTIKAIEELKLDIDKILWVGGSGCTGRMCTYWIGDYFHTLHGRPLGFATGVKLANPELTVICHMGDGEVAGIGGNHLIQTARRNVDLTAIVVNNFNYGMTGGQFSPTTPRGAFTMTSQLGHIEYPFDLCKLAATCGATYVARWTTFHSRALINSIKKGIQKKGLSFIEVISQCPTQYGRRNKIGNGMQMMKWFKRSSIRKEKAEKTPKEELKDKFIVGEFVDIEKAEFGASLRGLIKKRRKESVKN
ncbi:2-oxoacid:ferredoxin oxidoreductase subunit beta [Candidatus Aerophobetes bacterium]|nr:2-oxoacid:ferredoxin oxidoreductase subunit beta [Candidatus Aerophobetes bacterium]